MLRKSHITFLGSWKRYYSVSKIESHGKYIVNATLRRAMSSSFKDSTDSKDFKYFKGFKDTNVPSNCELIVTPKVAMHDVKTDIRAEGLVPHRDITLWMDLLDDRGRKFCSHAHYTSDANGVIDVKTMPSNGGSYKGVFQSGLLMTLSAAPGQFKYSRFLKEKIEEPTQIQLSLHDRHISSNNENPIANCLLKRFFVTPGTRVNDVEHKKVRGRCFLPPGGGPFPGVIDMYGGSGAITQHRAALLSAHGFATLALPFFNYKDLPKDMSDMELEYFEDAVDFLTSQPGVVPDRCGVLALCQGGYYALVMATWIDKVKACFLVNGAPSTFFSTFTYQNKTIVKGFDATKVANLMFTDESGHVRMTPESIEFTCDETNPFFVPVGKTSKDTHFYFAYGTEDSYKFYKAVPNILKRLDRGGLGQNYVFERYKDAGHFIEAPNIPFLPTSYQPYWPSKDGSEAKGVVMAWGGTAKGNSDMQDEIWPKAMAFFRHNICDKSQYYQNLLELRKP